MFSKVTKLKSFLIPLKLRQPSILFVADLKNFNIFFFNISKLGTILISESNLFHSMITDGKKVFLKKLSLTLQ